MVRRLLSMVSTPRGRSSSWRKCQRCGVLFDAPPGELCAAHRAEATERRAGKAKGKRVRQPAARNAWKEKAAAAAAMRRAEREQAARIAALEEVAAMARGAGVHAAVSASGVLRLHQQ